MSNATAASIAIPLPTSLVELLKLVGPWCENEFAIVADQIDRTPTGTHLANVPEAVKWTTQQSLAPQLYLLAQPRPNYYSQAEIDQLQEAAPLARIVLVAGTWCEAELHTGQPLQGVVRIYWYELLPWLRAAGALLAAGRRPPWSVPLDHARSGHSISVESRVSATAPIQLIVGTADQATFETLAFTLQPLGWQCVSWSYAPTETSQKTAAPEGRCAAVFEGRQLNFDELEHLRDFCQQMQNRGVPVLTLLDFPRAEHYSLARQAGSVAVLAKPYQLAILDHMLRATMPPVAGG